MRSPNPITAAAFSKHLEKNTPAHGSAHITAAMNSSASYVGERQPDQWVPDPIVAKEFHTTLMGLYRWTHDEKLGFPQPIKIRNRNFRSRRAIEEFKANLVRAAITKRGVA
ncbi:hypothetical protein ABIB94_002797 [Bradyrhizobium sp. JR7.2]|uniref:hypothetical protein n=1 Tax=unclassified Bradyrhizobium TaxID=2631580 RepID=UPI003397FCF1